MLNGRRFLLTEVYNILKFSSPVVEAEQIGGIQPILRRYSTADKGQDSAFGAADEASGASFGSDCH